MDARLPLPAGSVVDGAQFAATLMRLPNVLVILTDQQRWDCSGLHGNPLDLMPNFDAIARTGTHLRQSFSCQPLCVPARSCLQTGRYPTELDTYNNARRLPVGTPTLAHRFAAAGYRTGYIGKWHLAPRQFRGAVPAEYRGGYQDWLAANALELVSDAGACRLWDEQDREQNLPGYRVDGMTDAAIGYLSAPRTQPSFLFLSFLEPHQQNSSDDFPAPPGYEERYRGRWLPADLAALGGSSARHYAGYCGMVKRIDEAFGRICAELRRLGTWDETILLFSSDHGCHFKTRNSEYKRSCHESSIRVPTVFHGPGFIGGGQREELVSLIDLPPTLLDAAGLPVPPEMRGRSLMGRLRGDSSDWRDEIFIQISESQNARALRTCRWKYCVAVPASDQDRAKNESVWPVYDEALLYDLDSDPAELKNLIGLPHYGDVAGHLRQRLLARMAEAGDGTSVVIRSYSGPMASK